jgi:hypothetical protein
MNRTSVVEPTGNIALHTAELGMKYLLQSYRDLIPNRDIILTIKKEGPRMPDKSFAPVSAFMAYYKNLPVQATTWCQPSQMRL